MPSADFWRNRRVLVTGHTGFKGAWLCAMLSGLGARVSGYALAVDEKSSPFRLIAPELADEAIGDIREIGRLSEFVRAAEPEVVLHMAAQPLVRQSYAAPIETFEVNVLGTAYLLEALRGVGSIAAVLVITTDKVYENNGDGRPFREGDPLGGHDPYSASKACAEIVAGSYRTSFFRDPNAPRVATARSGNVIGGGDWSADRIVPDVIRAVADQAPVSLRYPDSVRPWLHVIEPLAGYLTMAEAMANRPGFDVTACNFAPGHATMRTVAELVDRLSREFDGRPGWVRAEGEAPPEASLLTLDASRAQETLGWTPRLDFDETLRWTVDWYKAQLGGADMARLTREQIERYADLPNPAAALKGPLDRTDTRVP